MWASLLDLFWLQAAAIGRWLLASLVVAEQLDYWILGTGYWMELWKHGSMEDGRSRWKLKLVLVVGKVVVVIPSVATGAFTSPSLGRWGQPKFPEFSRRNPSLPEPRSGDTSRVSPSLGALVAGLRRERVVLFSAAISNALLNDC